MAIRGAARDVIERARSVAKLQVDLAVQEIKEKLRRVGIGVGLGAGAALVLLYAVGFLLAATAAGLAFVMPWWAALLVVGVVLLMVSALLVALAARSFRDKEPVMTETIGEAKVTTETVTNALG